MNTLYLDGKKMMTRELTHLYLRYNLNLPMYYGNNLDALYDILSACDQEVSLILINQQELEYHLGTYGTAIIEVFEDVSTVNPKIKFIKK